MVFQEVEADYLPTAQNLMQKVYFGSVKYHKLKGQLFENFEADVFTFIFKLCWSEDKANVALVSLLLI